MIRPFLYGPNQNQLLFAAAHELGNRRPLAFD
jgi:hypothetical protein